MSDYIDDNDSSSSPLHGPSKGGSSSSRNEVNHEMNEIYRLVQDKTRVLFVWRIVFIVILICTLTVVSTQTYKLVTNERADDDGELVRDIYFDPPLLICSVMK